jgi:hypothetical protein
MTDAAHDALIAENADLLLGACSAMNPRLTGATRRRSRRAPATW